MLHAAKVVDDALSEEEAWLADCIRGDGKGAKPLAVLAQCAHRRARGVAERPRS